MRGLKISFAIVIVLSTILGIISFVSAKTKPSAKVEKLYASVKANEKSVEYKGKDYQEVLTLFNKKYLGGTNHSCVSKYTSKGFKLYPRRELNLMISESNRIRSTNKKKNKYIKKMSNKIIEASGANKAKGINNKLKCIENYFIQNFKYDYDYSNVNGDRIKFQRYQDASGVNIYYLYKKKKGICTDFAGAYKDICKRLGYSCSLEIGGIDNTTKRDHAWNVVKLGGTVLYKDITTDVVNRKLTWCENVSVETFLKNHHTLVSIP